MPPPPPATAARDAAERSETHSWMRGWELGAVNFIERDTLEERPDPYAAVVYIGDDRSIEVHGADAADIARLIAAAPDLLAALKHTTDALESLHGKGWETTEKARAAISRATTE